jgi:hypothetical protein
MRRCHDNRADAAREGELDGEIRSVALVLVDIGNR